CWRRLLARRRALLSTHPGTRFCGIGLSAEVMKEMIGRDAQGALTTFLRQVKNAPDLMGTLSDNIESEMRRQMKR
ncbi:MAG: hypothetical protein RJB43_1143, partial [Verrucomicrobiota bacterium]